VREGGIAYAPTWGVVPRGTIYSIRDLQEIHLNIVCSGTGKASGATKSPALRYDVLEATRERKGGGGREGLFDWATIYKVVSTGDGKKENRIRES